MVYNALSAFDSTLFNKQQIVAYEDEGNIAEYARDAVQNLKAIGILKSIDSNYFEPTKVVNRKEACQILYSVIEQLR